MTSNRKIPAVKSIKGKVTRDDVAREILSYAFGIPVAIFFGIVLLSNLGFMAVSLGQAAVIILIFFPITLLLWLWEKHKASKE